MLVTKMVKTVVDGQVVSLGEVEVDDGTKISPQLSLSVSGYHYSFSDGVHFAVSPITVSVYRLGEGVVSASVVSYPPRLLDSLELSVIDLSARTWEVTISSEENSSGTFRISVAETEDYLSEYEDIEVCFVQAGHGVEIPVTPEPEPDPVIPEPVD